MEPLVDTGVCRCVCVSGPGWVPDSQQGGSLAHSPPPGEGRVHFLRQSWPLAPLPVFSQYFEYTSQKEIRFNSVTELCAEVVSGQTSITMRHCPGEKESPPPSIIWEFTQVLGQHTHTHTHKAISLVQALGKLWLEDHMWSATHVNPDQLA